MTDVRHRRRREFYKSLFKRARDHVKRTYVPRTSPRLRAREAHRGCGSIIRSAVVVQRGGKVAYSFVARCIASFARGEKSRRPLNGHLNGLARWFMEPERKIGVASINRLGKIPRLFSPVACSVPASWPLDAQYTSNLRRAFEFELNARVGGYGIVLPLPGLIIGLTKFNSDPKLKL